MIRPIIAIVLVAGLCAPAPAARKKSDPLADAIAGKVAGKPTDCIDPQFSDGPQIIDSRTILYRETGRRVWRNDLAAACPALRPDVALIVRRFGSQLCRNDTFRVLEPGANIPSGICRFGSFTPYETPGRAK